MFLFCYLLCTECLMSLYFLLITGPRPISDYAKSISESTQYGTFLRHQGDFAASPRKSGQRAIECQLEALEQCIPPPRHVCHGCLS